MNIAILASGGGSNFESVVRATRSGKLSSDVVLCLSDRDSAGALVRAKAHQVPTAVVRPQRGSSGDFGNRLLAELEGAGADFIVLAGYLKMIPQEVIAAYRNRMVNIHPSLLPAFGGKGMYGRNVHVAALAHGVKVSGATVHLVDTEYDTGPIVAQRCVAVLSDDTAESLAARVLEVEHSLYPETIRLFEEGRVQVHGRTVRILEATPTEDPN